MVICLMLLTVLADVTDKFRCARSTLRHLWQMIHISKDGYVNTYNNVCVWQTRRSSVTHTQQLYRVPTLPKISAATASVAIAKNCPSSACRFHFPDVHYCGCLS